MDIIIHSPHIAISEKLEQAIRTKATHFERMYHRIESCDIILKKDNAAGNDCYAVEAKLLLPHKTLFVSKSGSSFENILDELVSTVNQQLQEYKEKQDERR